MEDCPHSNLTVLAGRILVLVIEVVQMVENCVVMWTQNIILYHSLHDPYTLTTVEKELRCLLVSPLLLNPKDWLR